MASELTKRVAVAAVGIPFAVFIIYWGGWAMAVVLAIIAVIGASEFTRIARARDVHPPAVLTMMAAAAYVIVAASLPGAGVGMAAIWLLTTVLLVMSLSAVIWTRGVEGRPLASAGAMVLAALLTGGTLAYLVFLRGAMATWSDPLNTRAAGFSLVAYPLAVTWINDTFAYFGGRALGKHKLIPRISPGKTVEGTIAGVLGSLLTSVLYTQFVFGDEFGLDVGIGAAIVGGLLISAAAVIGDLAESLLKREAGVKDSGTLLPGHGGVLDRFDALYFTLPVAYWFIFFVILTKGPR